MHDAEHAEQWLLDQIAAARARGDDRTAERLLAQHERELRERLRRQSQEPERALYHARARAQPDENGAASR